MAKKRVTETVVVQQQSALLQEKKDNKRFFKLVGNAILLASIQASIGSVEMSSKFSVVNFSKDQRTLQAAADALTGYIFIGVIWMVGSIMINFGQYGMSGLIASFIANLVMMGWIFISYLQAFQVAVKRYNLKYPILFQYSSDSMA